MNLKEITPLILTYNEANNLGRVLEQLGWADDIVIVDSGSTDQTKEIAGRIAKTRWFERAFDCHAKQWQFGLEDTGIKTEWILALDADYVLTEQLVDELGRLEPENDGYAIGFRYCIDGRPLRGSLYPPIIALYRRDLASYYQDGHTQRLALQGSVGTLDAKILHDDRKSFEHWLASQYKYAAIEAEMLKNASWKSLSWSSRLRRSIVLMPVLVPVYCLTLKGGILDGVAGLRYAFERALAEALIAKRLLELYLAFSR